ncbi:hypothetical protein [Comamonas odontotermitis]|uniref:hypothetical protein n=2 Tax=Comamonas odontotermitis TaxID=379895 RepID=UPI001CC5D5D0|nr:hypothetical protein [Comamonas odontotermitis]UBB18353.1 hypothetical protein LAD35_06865 [Comamonas odontotermitis]
MAEIITTQERYAAATQSSSLRVQGENIPGDADYLIAAGWCKSRFGAALMRLQAEWDGAERWGIKVPVKPTRRAIISEAQVTIKKGIRKITTESMEAARKKLEKRYETELGKVMRALKSLPEVAQSLQIRLLMDGHSADLAAPLLLHWLDPQCKACHGTGLQAQSERGCGKCREHPGLATTPGDEIGKEIISFLNGCASRASGETRSYCKH